MRYLLAALAVIALMLGACGTPAPTQADASLSMADYPQATPTVPAYTASSDAEVGATLTFEDAYHAAGEAGYAPGVGEDGSARCYEDSLMLAIWTGEGHEVTTCVALDDVIWPGG